MLLSFLLSWRVRWLNIWLGVGGHRGGGMKLKVGSEQGPGARKDGVYKLPRWAGLDVEVSLSLSLSLCFSLSLSLSLFSCLLASDLPTTSIINTRQQKHEDRHTRVAISRTASPVLRFSTPTPDHDTFLHGCVLLRRPCVSRASVGSSLSISPYDILSTRK